MTKKRLIAWVGEEKELEGLKEKGVFEAAVDEISLLCPTREMGLKPLYLGKIASLDDAERAENAGAERVAVGAEALTNAELVRRVSYKLGPARTWGLLRAARREGALALLDESGAPAGKTAAEWADYLKEQGAGELLLRLPEGESWEAGWELPWTADLRGRGAEEALKAANAGAEGLMVNAGDVPLVKKALEEAGIQWKAAGFDLSVVRFDERGLVPAIAQDAFTGGVLMLAYMNEESLRLTLETGYATYFSRSRQRLWKKGESSGHTQKVRELLYDCDGDTLLLKVEQSGPACHTGHTSCFYRSLKSLSGERNSGEGAAILQRVYDLILERRDHPKEGSYTNSLLNKGVDKIGKKLVEEAAETLIAAKNHSRDEIAFEASDLVYHLLVLLASEGLTLDDIYAELSARHRP